MKPESLEEAEEEPVSVSGRKAEFTALEILEIGVLRGIVVGWAEKEMLILPHWDGVYSVLDKLGVKPVEFRRCGIRR